MVTIIMEVITDTMVDDLDGKEVRRENIGTRNIIYTTTTQHLFILSHVCEIYF